MSDKPLYQITEGDLKIFDKVRRTGNINWFTNFYLRSKDSGTWWRPVTQDDMDELYIPEFIAKAQKWKAGYEHLRQWWLDLDRPEHFIEVGDGRYERVTQQQHDEHIHFTPRKYKTVIELDEEFPAFQHNHGMIFLPWQLEMFQAPQPIKVVVGGMGCISAETRIYDTELNEHVAVADLVNEKRAPVVLAWTGTRLEPIRASVPYLKGKASLYRVTMKSGNSFVATADHVSLTPAGWQRVDSLQRGGHLLESGAFHPQSILAFDQPVSQLNADHCCQTPLSSQADCLTCRHLYGEQLLSESNSVPTSAPSLDDVLAHSHENLHKDVQASLPERNQPCQPSVHPSTDGSWLLACHQLLPEAEFHASAFDDAPVLVQHQHREFWLSQQHYAPSQQVREFDLSADQVLTASSSPYLRPDHLRQTFSSGYLTNSVSRQDIHESWPNYQNRGTTPQGVLSLNLDALSAFKTSYSEPSYYNTNWGEIDDITYIGEGDYYDLHVPTYNSYLAEGVIHHNSGKTMAAGTEMLYYGAALKKFRGFALAPLSLQSNEVYQVLMNLMEGTLYEERFLLRSPTKPMNHLVLGNSLVGERNTIECYPILDAPEKVRTLTGDCAMIDQTEKLPILQEVIRSVGTRFRGQIAGRQRLNKMIFVANSGENPEMWDLYDEAATKPKDVWSASPNSADNIYLTIKDMKMYQKTIGGTAEDRRMFLAGGRPLGNGEYFPASSLKACKADWLDDLMDSKLIEQEKAEKEGRPIKDKAILIKGDKVGVYRWELPPEPDGEYVVCADPGWKNPPHRDSAAVSVWKINGFPFVPAQMVAFHWVYGDGKPQPWINQYTDYVLRYKAVGRNAYDATGNGAGYAKMTDINDLLPMPVNLGNIRKQAYVTLTQKIMAAGLLQMPSIEHIYSQLANYTLQKDRDQKTRQDLVMMIVVTCAWLEHLWYERMEQDEMDEDDNRYAYPIGADRYERSGSRETPRTG